MDGSTAQRVASLLNSRQCGAPWSRAASALIYDSCAGKLLLQPPWLLFSVKQITDHTKCALTHSCARGRSGHGRMLSKRVFFLYVTGWKCPKEFLLTKWYQKSKMSAFFFFCLQWSWCWFIHRIFVFSSLRAGKPDMIILVISFLFKLIILYAFVLESW